MILIQTIVLEQGDPEVTVVRTRIRPASAYEERISGEIVAAIREAATVAGAEGVRVSDSEVKR